MEDWKTIYEVSGTLCKDFIGQISYTVCLDKEYREMDIIFNFGPRHFSKEDVTPALRQELMRFCEREYGLTAATPEELDRAIYSEMKTELHTLASLNGEFIGGVHRQLETRHMYFSAEEATEGCIPQPVIEGVLRVTVLAFSVLLDNTHYTLTVRTR